MFSWMNSTCNEYELSDVQYVRSNAREWSLLKNVCCFWQTYRADVPNAQFSISLIADGARVGASNDVC